MKTVWDSLGLNSHYEEETLHEFVDGCIRDYFYAVDILDQLPEDRYAIVRYQDLITDPEQTVKTIYEKLGLDISENLFVTAAYYPQAFDLWC